MTCEVCGKGVADGVALYRQNVTGQPGIWRCAQHNQRRIDADVQRIVTAVEEDNRKGQS